MLGRFATKKQEYLWLTGSRFLLVLHTYSMSLSKNNGKKLVIMKKFQLLLTCYANLSKIVRKHTIKAMEAKLAQSLAQFGCNEKERQFFLACFKLGPSPISAIATKARLQRSTAYLIAEQLIEKELITQDFRSYNKLYTAASPQTLVRLIEAKKRRLGRLSANMQENIDTLEGMYGTKASLPVVKTYHGASGLTSAWKSILGATGEILLWTNQATEPRLFESAQHHQFIWERVQKGLPIRVLAVDNREGRALLPNDTEALRRTRFLPPETTFSAETYLYDNKVTILDYKDGLFGLTITNQLILEAQKSQFEMAWELSWRRSG